VVGRAAQIQEGCRNREQVRGKYRRRFPPTTLAIPLATPVAFLSQRPKQLFQNPFTVCAAERRLEMKPRSFGKQDADDIADAQWSLMAQLDMEFPQFDPVSAKYAGLVS
jgi:hypothetical protein